MIDFEALRKAEAAATPGRWEAEADGSQLMSVLSEPGDPAFLALARNLYLPLLDVAEAAKRMGHGHPSFHINECGICKSLATLAEAVEREQ